MVFGLLLTALNATTVSARLGQETFGELKTLVAWGDADGDGDLDLAT